MCHFLQQPHPKMTTHTTKPCACVMIFMATTSIWLPLFCSSSVSVPLPTATTSADDHPHDKTLCMRNDIHGNHKHLATVVQFRKCKCATSYHKTRGTLNTFRGQCRIFATYVNQCERAMSHFCDIYGSCLFAKLFCVPLALRLRSMVVEG